jgi:heme-degrading monooxygenase HmoA
MPQYHLANFNIARMVAPLESPVMQGFVDELDRINQLADKSPGFVWRNKDQNGTPTHNRPYDDAMILINLSVWESVEALRQFTYHSDHREVFRQRRKWFAPMKDPYLVLWWIPAGTCPGLEEGKQRLKMLRRNGPTAEAFHFGKSFPPPHLTNA